jgi:hypothetical protein
VPYMGFLYTQKSLRSVAKGCLVFDRASLARQGERGSAVGMALGRLKEWRMACEATGDMQAGYKPLFGLANSN